MKGSSIGLTDDIDSIMVFPMVLIKIHGRLAKGIFVFLGSTCVS